MRGIDVEYEHGRYVVSGSLIDADSDVYSTLRMPAGLRAGVTYYVVDRKESPKMKTPSEWIEDQYCSERASVGGQPSPPFGRTTAIMAYLDELARGLPVIHRDTIARLQERYPIGVQSHVDLQRALNEKTAECERQRQIANTLRGDRAEYARAYEETLAKLKTAESQLRMIQATVCGVKPASGSGGGGSR